MEIAQKLNSQSFPALADTVGQQAWPLRRCLTTVTLGWFFGSVWMNTTTGAPLTLFAKALGATPLQFGLLAAMPFIASLISVPASLAIEATGQRKRLFLLSTYSQRVLWVVIAIAPLLMISQFGAGVSGRAMGMFLGLMQLMHVCGAFGTPAWVSWMADVVPLRIRGRFFARRRQWGLSAAIPATLVVGWLLDRYGQAGTNLTLLSWCAGIFIAASIFGVIDIYAFQHLPHQAKPPACGKTLLRAMAAPLGNRPFLIFSAFVGMLTFGVSFSTQFVQLYLVERVKVGGLGLQLMTLAVPMLAQLLIVPAWGQSCDRIGRKPVLAIAGLGLVPIGIAWMFVGPSTAWLGFILAAGNAALWAGVEIANFNFVIEASGADPRRGGTGYVAANTVIVNVAGCLGGFAAGGIAESLQHWAWQPIETLRAFSGYDVLFVTGAVVRLASVAVFLPLIRERRNNGILTCLRFAVGVVAGNFWNLLTGPFRRPQPQPPASEPLRLPPPAETDEPTPLSAAA